MDAYKGRPTRLCSVHNHFEVSCVNMKCGNLVLGLLCLGAATAVIMKSEPRLRLIPADVLRGNWPESVYD